MLNRIAEDFVVQVGTAAAELARHRHSTVVEAKDIQLHLERVWDINVAGVIAPDEKRMAPGEAGTQAYQQTAAQVVRDQHALNSV